MLPKKIAGKAYLNPDPKPALMVVRVIPEIKIHPKHKLI
jgi:hypothetical protein